MLQNTSANKTLQSTDYLRVHNYLWLYPREHRLPVHLWLYPKTQDYQYTVHNYLRLYPRVQTTSTQYTNTFGCIREYTDYQYRVHNYLWLYPRVHRLPVHRVHNYLWLYPRVHRLPVHIWLYPRVHKTTSTQYTITFDCIRENTRLLVHSTQLRLAVSESTQTTSTPSTHITFGCIREYTDYQYTEYTHYLWLYPRVHWLPVHRVQP